MIAKSSKNAVRQRIHQRIRRKLMGTATRPRLNVYRSLNHIYAQLINDLEGVTLVSANSLEAAEGGKNPKASKGARRTGGNVASAKDVGKRLAARARDKGVSKIVFDRGGYLYHGRIKALADAAREAGLQF